jgi:Holliday junction resolvase
MPKKPLGPTSDVLYRIKRGLTGYVSYLAACEMNEAFSEYVLYEPILRILSARGFDVTCEVRCPGIMYAGAGDHKKLDFVAKSSNAHFALEIKWARSRRPMIEPDIKKLQHFCSAHAGSIGFLCIFGRKSFLTELKLPPSANLRERGEEVYADFGRTRYGCRMFEAIM